MRNFLDIVLIWTRKYSKIFKSGSVTLYFFKKISLTHIQGHYSHWVNPLSAKGNCIYIIYKIYKFLHFWSTCYYDFIKILVLLREAKFIYQGCKLLVLDLTSVNPMQNFALWYYSRSIQAEVFLGKSVMKIFCKFLKHLCRNAISIKLLLGKSVLKICWKFTGEHSCRSAISIKLLCNFIEITHRHGCSPVNLLHIFTTPFPRNTSGGLLL